MARRGVVFVGPSLVPPVAAPPNVVLKGPARRGDVLAEAAAGVDVIGLVDGELYQSLAVSPAEVRQASALGARLLGAASLGALRACECPGEMRGIGQVFRSFRDGVLNSDDEVAGTYAPGSYHTIAFPLVIVREAARVAVARGLASPEQAQALVRQARALPFHERHAAALQDAARVVGLVAREFLGVLLSDDANVKRRDAIELIAQVGVAVSNDRGAEGPAAGDR